MSSNADRNASRIFEAAGDLVQGLSSWFGLDSTISRWIRDYDGTDSTVNQLLLDYSKSKQNRQHQLDTLSKMIDELSNTKYGLSGDTLTRVARAIEAKKNDLQDKLDRGYALHNAASAIEDSIIAKVDEGKTLGQAIAAKTKYGVSNNPIDKYKEDLNNVQKEFVEETVVQ